MDCLQASVASQPVCPEQDIEMYQKCRWKGAFWSVQVFPSWQGLLCLPFPADVCVTCYRKPSVMEIPQLLWEAGANLLVF